MLHWAGGYNTSALSGTLNGADVDSIALTMQCNANPLEERLDGVT